MFKFTRPAEVKPDTQPVQWTLSSHCRLSVYLGCLRLGLQLCSSSLGRNKLQIICTPLQSFCSIFLKSTGYYALQGEVVATGRLGMGFRGTVIA
jgi:hypothetical protein